jgi:hypothetical protein
MPRLGGIGLRQVPALSILNQTFARDSSHVRSRRSADFRWHRHVRRRRRQVVGRTAGSEVGLRLAQGTGPVNGGARAGRAVSAPPSGAPGAAGSALSPRPPLTAPAAAAARRSLDTTARRRQTRGESTPPSVAWRDRGDEATPAPNRVVRTVERAPRMSSPPLHLMNVHSDTRVERSGSQPGLQPTTGSSPGWVAQWTPAEHRGLTKQVTSLQDGVDGPVEYSMT